MAEAAKSKTGLIIIIVVAVLIVGVVIYIFRDKLFGANCDPNRNGYDKKGNLNPKCTVADPANTNATPPDGTSGWVSDSNFPIKKGSWGPKVKALQAKIGADQDGRFGPKTEAALLKKTGKTQVATQVEYDAIVNPKANPVGGNNFDQVKAALGVSGKVISDSVYTTVKGENTPYDIRFYTNNRVAFEDSKTKKIRVGTYKDGGKEIVIDKKDGGYATGNYFSNNSVQDSMKKIISMIEGN